MKVFYSKMSKKKSSRTKEKGFILVTGGNGYIGTILVEELLNKGYAVKVLDTFYWGNEPLRLIRDKVEIIQADIRKVNPKILKNVFSVIHLAGLSNDPMAEFNPTANFEINTKATKKFAILCKKNRIKKFIFASSASIYDKGLLAEDLLQDEKSHVAPQAAYSLSKFKAERSLLRLADKNFCPVIFRQGTVYGFSPRMRYDLVVNTMLKNAFVSNKILVFCGGEQWRPLIEVRDVASAFIVALEAPAEKVNGQIFNLVYKNYRVLELAHLVKKVLKDLKGINSEIEVDYSPRKDRSYRISGEKIKNILGWEAKIPVEDSVKDMIKKIEEWDFYDFAHPKFYNIEWMKLLTEVSANLKILKRFF